MVGGMPPATRTLVPTLVLLLGASPAAASGVASLWLAPPVDGAVSAPFEEPVRKWGPGHRGVDFAVPRGTGVRAAARGRVVFAGAVAGLLAVTIDHEGSFQTTYSTLDSISVTEGEVVERGHWVGTSGLTHPGGPAGLHLGVKSGGRYLDPAAFLGPLDAAHAIHLAPLVSWASHELPDTFRVTPGYAGDHVEECVEPSVAERSGPPNDNVAVVVNGLASGAAGPTDTALYRHAVGLLGYPEERVYLFSYEGTSGTRLLEPYSPNDTYGDISGAARRLRRLVIEIGRRHPGADVDLVAHSQGGLVSRRFLQAASLEWSPRVPSVEHLVTLSTPHLGAPAAGAVADIEGSLVGEIAIGALSRLARRTELFPDPRAVSVAQMGPGSGFHELLAREDIAFGTRALALAVPDDFVVPAHRAALMGESNRILGPAGAFAHSRIVSSPAAAAAAYDFLRDAPPSCSGFWDVWGEGSGRALEWMQRAAGGILGLAARGASLTVPLLPQLARQLGPFGN